MIIMVNRIKLLKELKRYPVFTTKTIRDITGKERDYSNLIMYRLKKADLIFEIEKNKYTVHNDSFIVASYVVWPSYITGWAALQYYHLTEQLPWKIEVITTRSRKQKEINFGNSKIEFIKTKPEFMFGYGRSYYRGFEIFVADKEKAIADAYVFKRISEDELLEIIKRHINELNVKLISKYIRKMIRKPWGKKAKEFLARIDKDVKRR
jgi:predicted transcriptional regulator of viral defense system